MQALFFKCVEIEEGRILTTSWFISNEIVILNNPCICKKLLTSTKTALTTPDKAGKRENGSEWTPTLSWFISKTIFILWQPLTSAKKITDKHQNSLDNHRQGVKTRKWKRMDANFKRPLPFKGLRTAPVTLTLVERWHFWQKLRKIPARSHLCQVPGTLS